MRISDWSSDVCSSDLVGAWQSRHRTGRTADDDRPRAPAPVQCPADRIATLYAGRPLWAPARCRRAGSRACRHAMLRDGGQIGRAHVELQSLMRISYAVFCLNKKKHEKNTKQHYQSEDSTSVTRYRNQKTT